MKGTQSSDNNKNMSTNKKKGNQGRNSITDPSIAKLFEGKNLLFLQH
jgi:hypothetical protein